MMGDLEMKKILRATLTFMVLFGLVACGLKTPAWQEQYDLGVRYLSEGNYEEAIIAFTAAIEIDSKQDILYLSLSQAYVEIGDVDAAIDILTKGLENTASREVADQLQKLYDEQPYILGDHYMEDNWVRADEWTINGVPFWQASQADVLTAYPNPYTTWQRTGDYSSSYSSSHVSFLWSHKTEGLWSMDFTNWNDYQPAIPILAERGIMNNSTFETVLRSLGVNEEGIFYMSQKLQNAEPNIAALALKERNDENKYELTLSVYVDEDRNKNIWISYVFDIGMTMDVDFMFRPDSNEQDQGSISIMQD